MGTGFSVSPRKPPSKMDKHKSRSLSKPRLIVSAFGFKLMKQKSSKKVNPLPETVHIQDEVKAPPPNGEIKMPCLQEQEQKKLPGTKQVEEAQNDQPSHPLIPPPAQIVVQASTGELLLCLGRFLRRRCLKVSDLTSNEVIAWIRNVDRTLLMQGWQEEGFITAPVLVFVYLLCRNAVSEDITSSRELHGIFLTCLYLTYSYLGTEISYPLQPFLIDDNKDVFWQQALAVIDQHSSEMLRINMDQQFFTEVFQELKNEEQVKKNGLDR